MSSLTAAQLSRIPEIVVTFHSVTPYTKGPIIKNADEAYQAFLHYWDKGSLEYEEQLYVLFLNRGNCVLGVHQHSKGGRIQTVVDVGQIIAIALKANACALMIAHNHPSGRLEASLHDQELTKDLQKAAQLFKIELLDHLIITKDGYQSFCEHGLL